MAGVLGDQVDSKIAASVFIANSLRTINPRSSSVGLKTTDMKCAGLVGFRYADFADLFLINSRYQRDDPEFEASARSYFDDSASATLAQVERRSSTVDGGVLLPPSEEAPMALAEALRRRRSCRAFSGAPIPYGRLAALLRGAAGVSGHGIVDLTTGGRCSIPLRTAPSGGGLQAVQVFVAAQNIAGLTSGLYEFNSRDDQLDRRGDENSVKSITSTFVMPENFISVDQAGAVLILVGYPQRTTRKYGARGVRFMFLEAGYIAQCAHLMACALGLGSVDFQGFCDDEINAALGFDGLNQVTIHTVIVGTK